jgi:hypothetical protein
MCAAVLQGKRIDNTSVRDEPYEFVLGTGQVLYQSCVTWNGIPEQAAPLSAADIQ